jgi:hypothetical protein
MNEFMEMKRENWENMLWVLTWRRNSLNSLLYSNFKHNSKRFSFLFQPTSLIDLKEGRGIIFWTRLRKIFFCAKNIIKIYLKNFIKNDFCKTVKKRQKVFKISKNFILYLHPDGSVSFKTNKTESRFLISNF